MPELAIAVLGVIAIVALFLLERTRRADLEVMKTLVRDLTTEAARERDVLFERIQRPERIPASVPPRHTPDPEPTPEAVRHYANIGRVVTAVPDEAS